MPEYLVRVRPSTGWAILGGIVVVGVVAVTGFRSAPVGPSSSGSTVATLQVVPTMRSVTVSPTATTFAGCSGGKLPLRSTRTALGFPNGQCSIGSRKRDIFPIKITNGRKAKILVRSSPAIPQDGKTEWQLCNHGANPAVACKGPGGAPAKDQFMVENFSRSALNATGLAKSGVCDAEFGPSGDCIASTGESEREGILLIGPHQPDDVSTTWTVTITWTVEPPR